jgi:DNA-binding YbaB/EbfC family protein
MFKGLSNLASLVKQAQQIGGQMQQLNSQLKERRVTGTGGGGMVEVEVNGLLEVLRCSIDDALLEQGDRELLEDLVVGAVNQAVAKGRQLHADAMKELTGGLQLPGLQEALAKVTSTDQPPDPAEEEPPEKA